MKILLGINHLHELGGSEQYTYELIRGFQKKGYDVRVILGNHTLKGKMSDLIEQDFNIKVDAWQDVDFYDAAFLSHNSTVNRFVKEGGMRKVNTRNIYQICHGTTPNLEQPVLENKTLKFIAVTNEVAKHILNKSNKTASVKVIWNPIDTNKFYLSKVREKVKVVYSLSQNNEFNSILKDYCIKKSIDFIFNNKHTNAVVDVTKNMRLADVVVSLGRGCYEAMSMGKNVIIADARTYMKSFTDGLITEKNFFKLIDYNCSGRYSNSIFDIQKFHLDLEKCTVENARKNREIIVNSLDTMKIIGLYLDLIE